MKDITKSFPGVLALNKINFQLNSCEVHALVGENGAGKSTLMKILSGAYQPDSGSIRLNDEEIKISHPLVARKAGISIIYQEFNLIPHLSVSGNIFLGQEPTGFAGLIEHTEIYNRTKKRANPATFIIDKASFIRWKYKGRNDYDRPTAEQIIRELKKLQ